MKQSTIHIFTAISLLFSARCSTADGPVDQKTIAPVSAPESNARSAKAVSDEHGGVRLELARFSLAPNLDASYYEEYDGRQLRPGETVPIVEIFMSRSAAESAQSRELPAPPPGFELVWYHAMAPTDPDDPLCSKFFNTNEEGDRTCAIRWIRETLSTADSVGEFRLSVDALDVRPGGEVAFTLVIGQFAFHDGNNRPTHCCGELRVDVNSSINSDSQFSVANFGGWLGPFSCGYESIASTPRADACPAFW